MRGEVTSFGISGYALHNTFVLYDRTTDSLWYPTHNGSLQALSGARLGTKIPFVRRPTPQPLEEWIRAHPNTRILLPPPAPLRKAEEQPGWLIWNGSAWEEPHRHEDSKNH